MNSTTREIIKLEKEYNDPEAWLLGAILADNRCLSGFDGNPGILGLVEPQHFFEEKHRYIYAAMLSLNQQGIQIDNMTVYNELGKLGTQQPGDTNYLTRLVMLIIGPDNLVYDYHKSYYGFAQLVLKDYVEREALGLAGKIATAAKAHDLPAQEALMAELDKVVHLGSKDGQGLLVQDDGELEKELDAWYDDPQEIRGYRTGIERLDWYLGGLQADELVMLTGYTGSGKSTMVMQFAVSFCDQGAGLIVPTEMSVKQWKLRLIAYLLGTDDRTIRQGKYRDRAQLKAAYKYVNDLPIEWFQGSSPTPIQILTSARNLKRNGLIEWVIVDGLHDVRAEGEIYERTCATIDMLHEMAGLGLRVITTAHVNRGATEEPNPRDMLGAARIEQASTRILTLYRPGNLLESGEVKALPKGVSPNYAQIRLAKSRFSEAGGVVKLFFGKKNGRHGFFNADEPEAPPDYRTKED